MSLDTVKTIMWWSFWIVFFNLIIFIGTVLGAIYCHKALTWLCAFESSIFLFAGGIFYVCQNYIVKKAEKNL